MRSKSDRRRRVDATKRSSVVCTSGLTWSEYWVIDPELDEIKVFRHREDRYERVAELTLEHNDVLTSPLLPGLELPLNRIFGDSPLPG